MCKSIYDTFIHQHEKTKNGVKSEKDLMKIKIKDILVSDEMIKIPYLLYITP